MSFSWAQPRSFRAFEQRSGNTPWNLDIFDRISGYFLPIIKAMEYGNTQVLTPHRTTIALLRSSDSNSKLAKDALSL